MLHVLQLLFYCFLCRVLALAFALEEVRGDSQLKKSTDHRCEGLRIYSMPTHVYIYGSMCLKV